MTTPNQRDCTGYKPPDPDAVWDGYAVLAVGSAVIAFVLWAWPA
jgi:hypothetical protein